MIIEVALADFFDFVREELNHLKITVTENGFHLLVSFHFQRIRGNNTFKYFIIMKKTIKT
jgi:hypothetical protein